MDTQYKTSDYLTYKKSKMNPGRVQRVEKRAQRLKRIAILSLITFCIMFICVVIFIKKYAKRIDIEYGRNALDYIQVDANAADRFTTDMISESSTDKRLIDKRLLLIQQEENAPSESRVLPQDRDKNEVMNFEHYEMLKSSSKDEPVASLSQDQNEQDIKTPSAVTSDNQTNVVLPKTQTNPPLPGVNANTAAASGYETSNSHPATTSSKVLLGKYPTFEDAKSAQTSLKNSKTGIMPFIRRIDNVYALQIGSYANPDVARSVARGYKAEGFEVWIYHQ